ncbi:MULTISPECIES: regulator [Rahnella]|uniref:Regulator n=1 Tax=Rahnella laticis TaxID=2787622 RepID=A0ABS0DZ22_9GAMM|nr:MULTISPECIES: regulator [Rahnella]MBF7978085.1 regulator [Rahnella laticis]MBF7998198.1 regulator [Rahnella sp. LAC-M12]
MLRVDIEKIDRMISALKGVRRELKKYHDIRDKSTDGFSPKQNGKRKADLDFRAMTLIKWSHDLHALAVEIELADKRESYDEVILSDGWREFKYKPREPFPTCK